MNARNIIRRLVTKEAIERFMVAAIQSGKSPEQAEAIAAESISRVDNVVEHLTEGTPAWLSLDTPERDT